jgi:predicted RNase H-like nuclease (RuvC/YqgF family)
MRQLEATCKALERHNEDLTKELMKAQRKIHKLTNK